MDVSIFLAKVLGLYYVIMAVVMFVKSEQLKMLISEFNPGFEFFGGVLALIAGILLVSSHNLWVANWKVLITITAWMALIKGLTRLFYPEYSNKMTKQFLNSKLLYFSTAVALMLVGLFLCFIGFGSNIFPVIYG